MKTIEERANEWIKKKDTAAMILEHGGVSGAAKEIYIQGATEQQQIDIENMVEWLKECLIAECHKLECRSGKTEKYYKCTYIGRIEDLINELTSAMKVE